MQKFVIQQNIEHIEDLLQTVTAPEDRRRLETLLAQERARLQEIEDAEPPGSA